jgi:hypothetical protein
MFLVYFHKEETNRTHAVEHNGPTTSDQFYNEIVTWDNIHPSMLNVL